MKQLFKSISTQIILAVGIGFISVMAAVVVTTEASNRENEWERLLHQVNTQRTEIFRLLELNRRLDDVETESDEQSVTEQLIESVAAFDANQLTLRNGDSEAGIRPIQDPELVSHLDMMDESWESYRDMLLGHRAIHESEGEAHEHEEAHDHEEEAHDHEEEAHDHEEEAHDHEEEAHDHEEEAHDHEEEAHEDLTFLDEASEQANEVYSHIEHMEGSLNASVDEARRQSQTLIHTLGAITGAILLFLAFLFYRIIANLRQLQDTAHQIGDGEYTVRANTETYNELAEVGKVLNKMADSVLEREQSLNTANEALNQHVVDLQEARDEALASKRIADENSRLKSEFLSMMSHELRTPMNAIEGFTSIILKKMAGVEYNPKAERYLGKIQSNSQRLLALINDFLDLSRIESGRLELAHLPMSPTEMAQKWQENLSVLADNKGLEFTVSVDPALPETLYGDEESITKIAINLVGNAIKFTEAGSVGLSLEQHGDQLKMQVADTGIGIPPHARDFIFDEFRQVDQSSKRQYGGTGLGLSIVHKLAREMGGTVTLESEVGVGSTFTVTLPIHIVEEKQLA